MKKSLLIIVLLVQFNLSFSQAPNWVAINDTTSIIDYGFSSPGNPELMDTLGLKVYSYALDTVIGFQVLELKYPPCDSTNISFTDALQQTSGDTLAALSSVLFATSNSVILSSHTVNQNGLSALEINFKYNILNQGRVVVSYERLYYRKDLLLTFTITGFESDQTNLDAIKNEFFNSISF